jgi:hypothetical protein
MGLLLALVLKRLLLDLGLKRSWKTGTQAFSRPRDLQDFFGDDGSACY